MIIIEKIVVLLEQSVLPFAIVTFHGDKQCQQLAFSVSDNCATVYTLINCGQVFEGKNREAYQITPIDSELRGEP